MSVIKSKKHKFVGLQVPVYVHTSKREPGGSIFKRQPTDRKEGDVEILEVLAIWHDTVQCKVKFLGLPVEVTAHRYIDPSDISKALEERKSNLMACT